MMVVLAACSPTSEGDPGSSTAANDPTESPSAKAKDPASETAAASPNARTPITITAGDQTFNATLNKTQVAQDFAQMLPVTLPWFRNAEIEYITELDAP